MPSSNAQHIGLSLFGLVKVSTQKTWEKEKTHNCDAKMCVHAAVALFLTYTQHFWYLFPELDHHGSQT
jgi:hypothetical protein